MKSKYIFFNTAAPTAHIALFENGKLLNGISWEAGRELSRTLKSTYENLLKESGTTKEELAGVVVFAGPGSFTGLRIGISFANALASGLSIPVFAGNEKGEFETENPKEQVLPVYGAEPNITKPRPKSS